MQSPDSDQQPAETVSKQNADETGEVKASELGEQLERQEAQPIYEFPGSSPLPLHIEEAQALPAASSSQLQKEPEHASSGTPAQSGFVYPPPPSFYQNMPVSSQPLPPIANRQLPTSASSFGQTTQNPPRPENLSPSALLPPGPNAKKSNRWVWIVVTILSIAVLGSCGLCGWGIYTIFNTTVQQVSGSLDVVNDYYTNLQAQNYAAAYRDLAPQDQISGLTQDQFIKQAVQLDQQYGPVVSFVLSQPHFRSDPNTGPDLSHFTITVDVKRSHASYTTLLTLDKISGRWKITNYARL